MPEDGNRGAQIPILLCGLINPGKERPALLAVRHERLDRLPMALQERRRPRRPGIQCSSRRLVRAAEKEIGDTRECGCDYDQRPIMGGDEGRGALDGSRIGE
jgi:hypothetical protein